jgi:hypothetical protein
MPDLTRQVSIFRAGGLNANDQIEELFARAYSATDAGFQQINPVESPSMLNIDFDSNGISKRKGSTEEDDLTGVTVTDEVLLKGIEWQNPNGGARVEVIVGKKSIYTNQGGSFAQINNANGNAYTHNSDVTKVTFARVDGHLFIGMDGANNPIQVYRSGANLDDPFRNQTTATTVDADSSSGQTVLSVAATTMFNVGDRVTINDGGAREESGYIASISAGASITLEDNLTYTHTLAQADAVKVDNLYTESFGTNITNAYTGVIDTSYFLLASIHGRLVYSQGNTLLEYTPIAGTTGSGLHDVAGSTGGFYQASGYIRAIISFAPKYSNSLDENLFIGTNDGFEISTGFGSTDRLVRIEGSKGPLNHQSFAKAQNWIVYLTSDKNIFAINGATVIDLGRRAKTTDKDGPLDLMSSSDSESSAFGYYSSMKEQVMLYFSSSNNSNNDRAIVIDFKLGEPTIQEAKDSFEKRVRLLYWKIEDEATNDWFNGIYQALDLIKGVAGAGKTYTLENGLNDLGSVLIDGYWFSPVFTAGAEFESKQWLQMFLRGIVRGDWDIYIDVYLDRSQSPTKQFTFNQAGDQAAYGTATYGSSQYVFTGTLKAADDTSRYSEAIQWKVSNSEAGQTFVLTSQALTYLIGAEQR